MKYAVFALALPALLVSCSASNEDSVAKSDNASSSEVQSPAPVEERDAGSSSEAVSTAPSNIKVDLKEGVYSTAGCPPALASVSTFDGSGFNSRNFTDCEFTAFSHEADTYVGSQTCTDTYSRERDTQQISVKVDGPAGFTRTDVVNGSRSYKLCPDERLSDWSSRP